MTVIAMVLLPLPLNYANIIVLPLLLGVGVSFNIYFVMNWRAGQRLVLGSATARAILFSALTTGSAFGSLALSPHPGTASMGWLLLISLGFTLLASLTFLPALLAAVPRNAPTAASARSTASALILSELGSGAIPEKMLTFLRTQLDADELIAQAQRQTGLIDFGDTPFQEGLRIFLRACAEEADLSLFGRFGTRWDIGRFLANLLRLRHEELRTPSILEEPVERPIFITGLPRSGTTFLHRLLAEDDANLVPRVWQLVHPYPRARSRREARPAAATGRPPAAHVRAARPRIPAYASNPRRLAARVLGDHGACVRQPAL